MRLKAMVFALTLFMIAGVANAFSVRYYNKDSKTYKFDVKIHGNSRTIEFRASTTGTANVGINADEAEIKSLCGWITVKHNTKIIIKDGCIKID